MNRLKIILPLLMLFAGISVAHAQKGFHIGTTTTLNGSFIINQNNFETLNECPVISRSTLAYKFTLGYNLGVAVGYNFNKKLGLMASVSFNKGGQHYDDTYHPGSAFCPDPYHVKRNIDLTYIQVPLMFKYNFGPYKKKTKIYAMAGPEVGFLLGAKEQVWINDAPKTDLLPANQKFNSVDLGIALGTGIDYFITPQLYFEAGFLGYVSVLDINSSFIKGENWFGDNNVSYKKSYNLHPGIDVGIHFLFNKGGNPFHQKQDMPTTPTAPQ